MRFSDKEKITYLVKRFEQFFLLKEGEMYRVVLNMQFEKMYIKFWSKLYAFANIELETNTITLAQVNFKVPETNSIMLVNQPFSIDDLFIKFVYGRIQ